MTAKPATDERRSVACPLCGAKPGAPCVNTTTRQAFPGFIHRERRAPPSFPQYRTLPTAACPECLADCIYQGCDGWWCASCRHLWMTSEVAYFEGERDDD